MKKNDALKIVLFASGTHFMVHLYENSFSGILRSLQTEWGSDYAVLGTLGVPLFFLFGLLAIPGGWLSDRFGSKRILLVCLFGASFSSMAASFTPSQSALHPMIILSVLLACMGCFMGLYHPAGLSFISRGVEKKGRAMGIHGILGNFGLALAPFAASWLAARFGWRMAFLFLGFPALMLGFWLLLTPFEKQEGTGHGHGSMRVSDLFPKDSGSRRFSPILVLYLISMLNGLTYRLYLVYLPSFFEQRIGMTTFWGLDGIVLASFIATGILLTGSVGQWGGGWISDKGCTEKIYAGTLAVCVPLMWVMGHGSGTLLVVSCSVFSLFYFSLQPMKNVLLAHWAPKKAQGLTFGFIFFLEFGIGSFGSGLGGMIADRWGVATIFSLTSLLLAMMAIMATFLIPVGLVAPTSEEEVREAA